VKKREKAERAKRSDKRAGPRDLTPRQQRFLQVRAGRYLPLGDMEPIEVPTPGHLAHIYPALRPEERERHYVNLQLEHRANLLLQRLQMPLGLAQWFGTLGGRGIKAFRPFTVRKPNERRNWGGVDGWMLRTQIDALVKVSSSRKRSVAIDEAITKIQQDEPLKWGMLTHDALKTQYFRENRKLKKLKNVASAK